MKTWCGKQIETKEGIMCTAHMAEGRAFLCPYKDEEERAGSEHPCSDYEGGKET